MAKLVVRQLIESFWEPFPQALGLWKPLDRLSYQRRSEKLSSWGHARVVGAPSRRVAGEMHQECPLGGGLDLAT